jgi:FkbM family methyltransferase
MNFYGQLLLDKVLFERFFKDKKNGTFIECGAFDGLISSNTYFFYKNMNWRGYNIEPVPRIFKELEKNRPEDKNYNIALSDANGESIFTQAITSRFPHYEGNFGNGSLRHSKKHLDILKRDNCSFETFKIKTTKISSFYSDNTITKPIDLFILDVEGHEPDVLSVLSEVKSDLLPKVLAVEYGHCGEEILYKYLLPLEYELKYRDSINLVFQKT